MDLNDSPLSHEEACDLLRVGQPRKPFTFLSRPSRFVPPAGSTFAERRATHAEFGRVVGALWDHAVAALNRPAGYADLTRLREALEQRAKPSWRLVLEMRLRTTHAAAASQELDRIEHRLFGDSSLPSADRTLRALSVCDLPLGWEILPDHLASYGWGDGARCVADSSDHVPLELLSLAPPFSVDQHVGVSDVDEYHRYDIDPAAVWNSISSYEFSAETTFDSARSTVASDRSALLKETQTYEDRVSAINIRAGVVRTILYEYEVVGYVQTWKDLSGEVKEEMLGARDIRRRFLERAGQLRQFYAEEEAKDDGRSHAQLCVAVSQKFGETHADEFRELYGTGPDLAYPSERTVSNHVKRES